MSTGSVDEKRNGQSNWRDSWTGRNEQSPTSGLAEAYGTEVREFGKPQ